MGWSDTPLQFDFGRGMKASASWIRFHTNGVLGWIAAACLVWLCTASPVLAEANTLQSDSVAPEADGDQYTAVTAGGQHSCALQKSGRARCWGRNHQGQTEPPPVGAVVPSRATFPFANLANHWYGHATVQRRGKTITATIAAVQLPVQYAGRQAPAPLLVLPAAWRPAIDIEWEVSGDSVLQDGNPDPLQQQIRNFTLRSAPMAQ